MISVWYHSKLFSFGNLCQKNFTALFIYLFFFSLVNNNKNLSSEPIFFIDPFKDIRDGLSPPWKVKDLPTYLISLIYCFDYEPICQESNAVCIFWKYV